ncbi:MAG: hypothetical protein ACKVX9_10045 [Blastocatellia bacterium]
MNCKEFETICRELAADQLMEAGERARALAHVAGCPRCDARLRDEHALALGLRALADEDKGRGAPDAVESALLAAFRDSSKAAPAASGAATPTWRRSPWVLAAAAALLLACGLFLYRAMRQEPPADNVTFAPSAPAPSILPPRNEISPRTLAGLPTRAAPVKPRGIPRAGREQSPAPPPPFIRDEMTLYSEVAEVATDFLPLTYSDRSMPMESGQLIRVQMPQSALAKFGLPVNIERADVPVKADLLVGEDGLARAIRFVR